MRTSFSIIVTIAVLLAFSCQSPTTNSDPAYEVTYNANGATSGTVPTDSNAYAPGAIVTVSGNTGNLAKSGYVFAGWNSKPDGSGTAYAVNTTFTMNSATVILYASWTSQPVYTVTYDANGATGGTVPTDSNVYVQGTSAIVLDNTGSLAKSGYTFAGWNSRADGNGTAYAANTTLPIDAVSVTLYAVWTLLPTYTIIYDANGATGGSVPTDSNNYLEGATVTVLGNTGSLAKTGCGFAGWNTRDDGSGISYAANATFGMGSSGATLYAVWTPLPTYKVTYHANGATGGSVPTDSSNYLAGATVTVLGNTGSLAKTGCGFAGWNTRDDGTGTLYAANATFGMGSSDVTLYAKWATWKQVGAARFTPGEADYASFKIAPDDTPYIAFRDGAAGYRASVMKYANGSWAYVGTQGFSKGKVSYTSLAIDASGTPYVAYSDEANGSKVSVMKYSGGIWTQVGTDGFSAGQTYFNSLAIDPSGTPYVAYSDGVSTMKGTVMKYSGAQWEGVGIPGFTPVNALDTRLAFGSNGTPYVAYSDGSNSSKASVMRYSNGSWVQVGSPGFTAGVAGLLSFAIDSNGTPYVAYFDVGNSSKASVMKFTGAVWEQVGTAGFSVGMAKFIALVFDSGDIPYVAYEDSGSGNKASVSKFSNGSWVSVGMPGFSAGQPSYISLAFTSTGTLTMGYIESLSSVKKANVMKFE